MTADSQKSLTCLIAVIPGEEDETGVFVPICRDEDAATIMYKYCNVPKDVVWAMSLDESAYCTIFSHFEDDALEVGGIFVGGVLREIAKRFPEEFMEDGRRIRHLEADGNMSVELYRKVYFGIEERMKNL